MTNRSVQYLSWMFFFYGIKFTFVTLLWNASGIWGVSFLVGWLRDGSLSVTSVTVEWTLTRVMTDTLQYLSVYAPEIIKRRLNGQKKYILSSSNDDSAYYIHLNDAFSCRVTSFCSVLLKSCFTFAYNDYDTLQCN